MYCYLRCSYCCRRIWSGKLAHFRPHQLACLGGTCQHYGSEFVHTRSQVDVIINHSTVLTVTIAVGIQDRPASAPQTGEWTSDWKLVGDPTFGSALGAISSLIFSFAGTPAFFSIVSEMRDQKHYNRSLFVCQGAVTITYSTIGIVVYIFCGSFVASPALGSAGVLMKKVCYGLALPGLFVTTVLFIHVRLSIPIWLKDANHCFSLRPNTPSCVC